MTKKQVAIQNKKMKSLNRILHCAENHLLSYKPYYERDYRFCAIGCLFDKELLATFACGDESARYLFIQYPGLCFDTGLSVSEAHTIQTRHDNLTLNVNRVSIFVKQVKSWISSKGVIV